MKTMILLFSLFLGLLMVTPGYAGDNFISKKSPYSVEKTIERLQKVLEKKGITVFKLVDHGAGAKRVGETLRTSQLLIFGNPKTGSPLMREAPMMGLELPMKALAWEDDKGQVWLSYLKPSVLQARYGLKNQAIIDKITAALDGTTSKAVSQE
jgi:uncharacterized protein (DUF302 family)